LSGSDLSVALNDALFQPIRELEHTEYFKLVKGESHGHSFMKACKKEETGATKIGLLSIPPEMVQPRDLSLEDVILALGKAPRTVLNEMVERYENFSKGK